MMIPEDIIFLIFDLLFEEGDTKSFVQNFKLILTGNPEPEETRVVISLLSRLTNIRSFDLIFSSREVVYFDWFNIFETLRMALSQIIVSPQLSALSLLRVRVPLAQLLQRGLTGIQDLDIFRTQSSDKFDEVIEAAASLSGMADLSFRPRKVALCPGQKSTLLDSRRLDWSEIRDLRLSCHRTPSMGSEDTARACAEILPKTPRLRCLQIGGPYDAVTECNLKVIFGSPANPQIYNSLTQIRVYMDWRRYSLHRIVNEDPYMGLFESLSKFPQDNVLESVYLQISITFSRASPTSTISDFVHPARWTRISSILTSSAFPSLKPQGVHLDVVIALPQNNSLEGIADVIRGMPWGELQTSKKLLLEIRTFL